ncbi:MAG TPA: nuclear transport factor 2 family protein [Ktedonobacterales bacterium]
MATARADEQGDEAERRTREEIAGIVGAINAAWVHGNAGEMAEYLDEGMVIVQPGFEEQVVGREACVESYREFASHAAIRQYDEGEVTVDVRGDTAIASYRYAIEYEMDGETYHDAGHDVFVLMRGDGGWHAVWRTLIPQEH